MSILKYIKSQLYKWIGLFISLLEWCFLVLKKEVIQTFPGFFNSGLWFPKLWLLQPSQRIHLVTLSSSVWCRKFLSYTMRNFGEDSNGCVLRLTSSWSRTIPSWCKKKKKSTTEWKLEPCIIGNHVSCDVFKHRQLWKIQFSISVSPQLHSVCCQYRNNLYMYIYMYVYVVVFPGESFSHETVWPVVVQPSQIEMDSLGF